MNEQQVEIYDVKRPKKSTPDLNNFTESVFEHPEYWSIPKNDKIDEFPLLDDSSIREQVLDILNLEDIYEIASISQYQNYHSWSLYMAMKESFQQRVDSGEIEAVNETYAIHGTCASNVTQIILNGPDRIYNKTSLYGKGTYYAKSASYSLQENYAKPDNLRRQTLLVCRILRGDSTIGNPSQIISQKQNGFNYDSLTNPEKNIYVIPKDHQEYIEFKVLIKKHNCNLLDYTIDLPIDVNLCRQKIDLLPYYPAISSNPVTNYNPYIGCYENFELDYNSLFYINSKTYGLGIYENKKEAGTAFSRVFYHVVIKKNDISTLHKDYVVPLSIPTPIYISSCCTYCVQNNLDFDQGLKNKKQIMNDILSDQSGNFLKNTKYNPMNRLRYEEYKCISCDICVFKCDCDYQCYTNSGDLSRTNAWNHHKHRCSNLKKVLFQN